MLNLCYLNDISKVDIKKVKTYPETGDGLDYTVMLATFYSLVDVNVRESWEQERVNGTFSGFIYNKFAEQLLIQECVGDIEKQRQYKEESRIDTYYERALRAIKFSFLLRGEAIVNYAGFESILYLVDNNQESIFDYKDLVRLLVTERFKYIFYIKNDTALLVEVEELRKDYWKNIYETTD